MSSRDELVVLLDDTGAPTGSAPKATVHTADTPLHLAFSCFLFNSDGQLLMTRRALSKRTWPGVWTNSFCGHPAPGEDLAGAIIRRSVEELGCAPDALEEITMVVPDFRYRATDSSGVVEHEICPVFTARLRPGCEINPREEEVDSFTRVDPADVVRAVELTPFAFSPWIARELEQDGLRRVVVGKR